jgi:fused signal recognition particle receptor
MFGKLKEKLKSWFKSSTEKIEETAEKIEEERPAEIKKEKAEKKSKKEKKIEKLKEKEESLIREAPKTIKEADEEIKEAQEIAEEIEQLEEKEKVKEVEIGQLEKEAQPVKKLGFFSKLKASFSYKITIDEFDSIFNDLEMLLLENNVALEVVEDIRKKLSEKLIGREIKKENLETEIKTELKNSLNELLIEPDNPLEIIQLKKEKPFVILFFGINGTGKTTSIAKLAHLFKKHNLSVVLAAADTFRAASIEQIQVHADRLKVPLVKHEYGSDPSSVGFDAIKYAKAHKIDVVLIDTAGRMHTKTNLLAEMEKICRVTNPDLKVFVAESIAGNDATEQAKSFHEMINIDGSILSKADIDEKGGTIISVSHTTHKPIFYLGTGQEYKDLKLFNKSEFIESLGL